MHGNTLESLLPLNVGSYGHAPGVLQCMALGIVSMLARLVLCLLLCAMLQGCILHRTPTCLVWCGLRSWQAAAYVLRGSMANQTQLLFLRHWFLWLHIYTLCICDASPAVNLAYHQVAAVTVTCFKGWRAVQACACPCC